MKKIIGAAIGKCVHIGGLYHFLKLAEREGFSAKSFGPAVPPERLIKIILEEKPDIVALSYRLTPDSAAELFDELRARLNASGLTGQRMLFGGTPPVVNVARQSGLFARAFDGTESIETIRNYLRGGENENAASSSFAGTLTGRIEQKYPYPLIRHHFGRPDMKETLEGVEQISDAGVLDVISIGPDQNAQEHFFRPEEMDHSQDGAGGVPLRTPEDLAAIYKCSRRGNYPLVRCYSGTRDLIQWAEMSITTINIAWAAIPLCWYSVLDGRSSLSVQDAIREHHDVIRWYASREVPVEVNESHQWSLRDAHDSLAVTMAFLAAYNARKCGVKNYVSQYMFNTPPGTSGTMDIAKMLAKNEMIEELQDDSFKVFRQVRAGLAHFSPEPSIAKGQLAASAALSLSLKPHILHVVGYSEGDHAILPDELIESCNIVHGVLHNTLYDMPDMTLDEKILRRKNELINEAAVLLEAIRKTGGSECDDPWCDPLVIAGAIRSGLLDTPHFLGNPALCGTITTGMAEGACYAVNPMTGEKLNEETRIKQLTHNKPE